MKHKNCFLIIGLMFIVVSFVSCGPSRQQKTDVIIGKLNLLESQKTSFKFQFEGLKYQARGEDSIRVLEMERQLSDEEILKRINEIFAASLSDKDVNDIYNFVQKDAFEKLFAEGELYQEIYAEFKDITDEIEYIAKNLNNVVKSPVSKFKPIKVDKENGFYATVDYNYSDNKSTLKLEEKPSVTSQDIRGVKKDYGPYSERPEILIEFTQEGAKKFYLLTEENIGKPIAIVVAGYIVSMPVVNQGISGGKASINGDFTEEEIDKMIECLKEK